MRVTAASFVALILHLVVAKQNKEMALLLMICVCCMIGAALCRFADPIIRFVEQLQDVGEIDVKQFEILLKVVGISFLAEVTTHICSDAGNGTLGKMLQLLSSCMILWLSIPLLSSLLSLIEQILGEI